MKQLEYEEVAKLENKVIIDVRSPKEFESGTIFGSINIPLLDDDERVEIGIIYKELGTIEAQKRGLEIVAPKLPYFYTKALELSKEYNNIVVFCARGGQRSTSFVKLLDLMGIEDIYQLKGGMKKYRRFVLNTLDNLTDYSFIVVHGPTGVGKTKILQQLEYNGYPVLDLEGLAHNKGSVFGHIGERDSVNQKDFENAVANQLLKYKNRHIFIESESQRIGNVSLSNVLMEKMKDGHHVLVETNIENRIEVLVESYVEEGQAHNQQLINALNKLRKRLGNERVEKCIQWINEEKYSLVAEELLSNYYDPLYRHSIEKYNYDLVLNYDKIEEAIKNLSNFHCYIEGKT